MDGFLKYLISKFGELFSLLWYYVYKWIDRKIPYGVVVVTASLTVETKFLQTPIHRAWKLAVRVFAFLYYFVAVVYQISHAVELPENDKDGCFHKLIHLKTQVHSTQVFLGKAVFPGFQACCSWIWWILFVWQVFSEWDPFYRYFPMYPVLYDYQNREQTIFSKNPWLAMFDALKNCLSNMLAKYWKLWFWSSTTLILSIDDHCFPHYQNMMRLWRIWANFTGM